MMKSPTSLIRFRNAVGVMLALSAVFAVVISTISMPGDKATAQVLSETEMRAMAWWDTLTPDQRINALAGKEYDETADEDATRVDTEYAESPDTAADTTTHGEALVMDYAEQTTAGYKTTIDELVDGANTALTAIPVDPPHTSAATTSVDPTAGAIGTADIYAVGEDNADIAQTIRGFQSVELWWNHLTCAEARIAVGEDRDSLSTADADTETAGFQAESTMVCDDTLNAAGDALESVTTVKAYSALSADTQAQANAVGQAILGLEDNAGDASSTDPRAKAWWDSLTAAERLAALYGSTATAGTAVVTDGGTSGTVDGDDSVAAPRDFFAGLEYDQIQRSLTFHSDASVTEDEGDLEFPLDSASMDLADEVKALINDRWRYVYAMGGSNTMGTSELVYWWDSLDSAQRRIAAGVDNAPEASPTAAGFSVDWSDLNPLTGTPAVTGTAAGKVLEEQVFQVGQAILGHKKLPDVAAWWATLNADQMVYVVYGNPLLTEDADTDNATPPTHVAHANDRAMFQVPYAMLTGHVIFEDLHPATTVLLARHGTSAAPGFDADESGTIDTATYDHDSDDTTDAVAENAVISTKLIVDAIAAELFDPPAQLPGTTRVTITAGTRTLNAGTEADDEDFDWPYNSDNKAANVADWWETTDCRVMRLAVGQDNDYFHTAVDAVAGVDADGDGDFEDTGDTRPVDAIPEETSIYCAHFPGHDTNDMNDLSEEAQKRVVQVGAALLGLTASVTDNALHAVRPSFNEAATGDPLIEGTAQVGATLEVNTDSIDDEDGLGDFSYQWFRNGVVIPGATGTSYVLTAADAGATISVQVSFIDGERYPEMRKSPDSLATSSIVGAAGVISKIEEAIRGVTVSAGDRVILSVKAYGLQGVQDQKLSAGMGLEWTVKDGAGIDDDDAATPWEITYKAPPSPGRYTIVASFKNDGDCRPLDKDGGEAMRDTLCSATFEVQVRRPSAAPPVDPAPVNPPGEIPGILADDAGNQYEVFTPVEGGTFSGEGYSITAPSGAVPNGEFIGVRISDDGAASNVGMTHQRYTLGGNMYGVHAVDASGASVSSYALDDPATVCLPLPDALRQNISDLAVVAINSDGSLTILSAQVRISTAGTMVCGGLSNLPASVAVGSAGAPAAIPTATPEPTPEAPETGGSAPASSTMVLWALMLGIAVLVLGSVLVISRRREGARK